MMTVLFVLKDGTSIETDIDLNMSLHLFSPDALSWSEGVDHVEILSVNP